MASGGDDSMLAARDMGQGVPHPMNATALPRSLEHAGDGGLEARMGIADHQPDTAEPARLQGPQELGPKSLGFRGTDAQADDLAPSFGIGGDGDYGRDRHDTAALADFQIGGVAPE